MGQENSNLFEKSIFASMSKGVRPGGLGLTQRLVDYCDFSHGAIALDVGCGTGTTVQYLRDIRGVYAFGVDLSAKLVAQGKKRTAGLQLIHAPGENIPFADESIDGVIAECSLSVMSDVGRVLTEINRILIPGGKLGITDLYVRDGGCEFLTGNSSGIKSHSEIIQVLVEHGFKIKVFEDQSKFLREFVASFIMEHGGMEEICQCTGIEKNDKNIHKLGYFLLTAEKCS